MYKVITESIHIKGKTYLNGVILPDVLSKEAIQELLDIKAIEDTTPPVVTTPAKEPKTPKGE